MKHETTYPRHRGVLSMMIVTLILTLATVLGIRSPAIAAECVTDNDTFCFDAGVACDFPLQIDLSGGNQVFREFVDKNGNPIRSLSTGTGSALVFTNLDTGTTFSTRSNGAVTSIRFNPDGSQTFTITGHVVLILFPTDIPAGPSTTLYVGRIVFTVDTTSGVFTLLEASGQSTDICAALD
jgi:hypothetical protein